MKRFKSKCACVSDFFFFFKLAAEILVSTFSTFKIKQRDFTFHILSLAQLSLRGHFFCDCWWLSGQLSFLTYIFGKVNPRREVFESPFSRSKTLHSVHGRGAEQRVLVMKRHQREWRDEREKVCGRRGIPNLMYARNVSCVSPRSVSHDHSRAVSSWALQ